MSRAWPEPAGAAPHSRRRPGLARPRGGPGSAGPGGRGARQSRGEDHADGDSITNGVGATGGYRLELKDLMVPEGHSFDYVGAISTGPFEIEDRQHEGRNGWKIGEIAAIALRSGDDVPAGRRDADDRHERHHHGHGAWHRSGPARQPARHDLRRRAERERRGRVDPAAGEPADETQAQDYNAALPGVVDARVAAGKKAYFVDVHAALTVGDLVDGVHPNADGYPKIARAWLPTLRSILPAPPASSAVGCPCSLWPEKAVPATPRSARPRRPRSARFRVEKYGRSAASASTRAR